ncbi:hypothetical protein [Treponema phagedenis]|uniref:hypothetical protein n=1 Tax=Treponema phagedenis TaxID=162 RepID=UPI0001F6419E|nr:hypothetical protein [Treponema phagedenis]EFW38256.1 hypothetical protein HMPREF9554_01229 [Treponema phagedenis F0421]TYT79347.1 hypothetical protein FS559_09730 [Treponema phagedenis]
MIIGKKLLCIGIMCATMSTSFAFEKGFVLGLRANFLGSYTDPHINEADKKYLGAAFMEGMVGFIMNGEVDITYIFDAVKYFKLQDNKYFGGLGLSFDLGVGQGFSGQISGQYDETSKKDIRVYARVYMTPVITFGTGLRTYLFRNRMSINFYVNGRMPVDPQPVYEMYTNLTEAETAKLFKETKVDFYPETGTLVVSPEQMKKINPLGVVFKGTIEYNQPVIPTMELVLGTFLSYTVYRPKYVTMPKKVVEAAKAKNPDVNFERDQIKSFYMNSLDFGLSLGFNFKV